MPSIRDIICAKDVKIGEQLIGPKAHTRSAGFPSDYRVENPQLLRQDPLRWAQTVSITLASLPSRQQMLRDAKRWHDECHESRTTHLVNRYGDEAIIPDRHKSERPNHLLYSWVRHRYTNYDNLLTALEKHADSPSEAYVVLKNRTMLIVSHRINQFHDHF